MTYLDDLKAFNELREGTPLISVQTYPNFNAPGCQLTGGTSLCSTLDEAKSVIESDYSVVWTVGFENDPSHDWNLVSYEIFSPYELKIPNVGKLGGKTIHDNVIFCYYYPANYEFVLARVEAAFFGGNFPRKDALRIDP